MPIRVNSTATWLTIAYCTAFLCASANGKTLFDEDFDNPQKRWEEIAIQLPAPPQRANLLSFYASPTTTTKFEIDTKSISVGEDGVVRYILVATSASHARNISYEGIRCASYERKLYAFGQTDGSWTRSRRDQWEPIQGFAANRHHAALFKEYFCMETAVAGDAKDIVYRLKNKRTILGAQWNP